MLIKFYGRDVDQTYQSQSTVKLRDALIQCNILPSTVIVSYRDQIIPLSTMLSEDIELLVTTVSSGG